MGRRRSRALSRGERQVFGVLWWWIRILGVVPSRREIADALRWRSTNYVNEIVDRLAKRGLVRLARGRGRALQIMVEDSGCTVGPVPTVTLDSATAHEIASRFISCPIVR